MKQLNVTNLFVVNMHQDHQLLWNTSTPSITPCLRSTVLEWTPPVYLTLATPMLVYSLIKSWRMRKWPSSAGHGKHHHSPWNAFNVIRQVMSLCLVTANLVDLISLLMFETNKSSGRFEDTLNVVNATIQLVFAVSPRRLYCLARPCARSNMIHLALVGQANNQRADIFLYQPN